MTLYLQHFYHLDFYLGDILPPFYNQPEYINAMSETILRHLKGFEYDHILFSYHVAFHRC